MGRDFTVNGTAYTPQHILIIAELGTSHQGDRAKARDLVDAAAEAGARCIKFQLVYAAEILHPLTGEVPLPGGMTPLYDIFKSLECTPDFYGEMKEYVEKRGLLYLCTPFGLKSAGELRALKAQCIKIASPELNYTALLEEVASYGLPAILSSGVSTLADIEAALNCFSPDLVCLLHCVTAYPAPEEDYNLRLIKTLGEIFGIPMGLSDHSLDPELVPLLAQAMGAAVVEKHFCLSRSDPGLDDPIALPPEDFARMCHALELAEKTESATLLETLARERGRDRISAVLGTGIKKLAPSELANYGRTNRSLHALEDIQAGDTIQSGMVGVLRTEKILRPGLPPSWERQILGRTARAFIPAGEGIRFEDV